MGAPGLCLPSSVGCDVIEYLQFGVIVTCSILYAGVFTQEKMKNYRSLEAYNFFRSGWVQTVFHFITSTGNVIFKADVRPSWRVTEIPHHPWVVTTSSGCIIAAHCDCMAGLGETCSHVAALLFKIEAAVRLGYATTVSTDVLCQWNQSFVPRVEAATVSDINFYKAESKQQYLAKGLRTSTEVLSSMQNPLSDNQHQFLSSLAQLPAPPVVLSTSAEHNTAFVDESVTLHVKLPPPLSNLYMPTNVDLCAADLSSLVQDTLTSMSVTDEQIDYVESCTTAQSSCLLWHRQRVGRITASVAHSVLHSSIDNFAPSIVKKICSTDIKVLNTPAVKWGRTNESVAVSVYTSLMTGAPLPSRLRFPDNICMRTPPFHVGCTVTSAGFRICKDMPFIGASADGYVMCDCHGKGVVEIKCPYTDRNTPMSELVQQSDFFILPTYAVRSNHRYYTQIQMQMYVCNVPYCDLVVWQPDNILIVRVDRDDCYIGEITPKLYAAYERHVLPELLTHSLQQAACTSASVSVPPDVPSLAGQYDFCVCKTDLGGKMIGCDNSDCNYKWFHLQCLKMKRVPRKSPWFCKFCVSGKPSKK